MLFQVLLFVHCALCVALIGLVLLQQGKGADAGATFGGGSSNTFFGAGGATDLVTRTTTALAILFMVTSIFLVRAYTGGMAAPKVTEADPLSGSVMQEVVKEVEEVTAPAEVADVADDVADTEAKAPVTDEAAEEVAEETGGPSETDEQNSKEEVAKKEKVE